MSAQRCFFFVEYGLGFFHPGAKLLVECPIGGLMLAGAVENHFTGSTAAEVGRLGTLESSTAGYEPIGNMGGRSWGVFGFEVHFESSMG